MKKLLTLASMATLLMAGSAFAQWGRHAVAQPNATFAFGSAGAIAGTASGPSTTNNADSCDISVTPAATLLLPYFEVDTGSRAVDTLFTITNVGPMPQIAHVTVWTDWSFAVLDFNVFLTGYDVQALSMYDIVQNGIIAPAPGSTTSGGTSSSTTPGSLSFKNTANANLNVGNCGSLPGPIPAGLQANIRSALINGTLTGAVCGVPATSSFNVGSPASSHTNTTTAVGYITIDVVSNCSTNFPDNAAYATGDLLFDNVLIGDYEIINKATGSNYAGGNPLVHIRAVPEGGPSGAPLTGYQTNLPYTFYSRYINPSLVGTATNLLGNYDRRQPLPSTFAARWIQGGPSFFNTSFRIWREGKTSTATSCAVASSNSALAIADMVRFDEHENPSIATPSPISGQIPTTASTLPETSTKATSDATFPQFSGNGSPAGDVAGWMYLNLNSGAAVGGVNTVLHPAWPTVGGVPIRPSQNWVIVSMAGAGSTAGLYSVDFDAAWLGNGCTPATTVATSSATLPNGSPITPAGGVTVCPPDSASAACVANTTPYNGVPVNGNYTGTRVTP